MITHSAFHLDCTPIIPECEFECAKCIKEIESTFAKIQGVDKAYMKGEGESAKIIVEHDPTIATVEHLMEEFRHLPSFYKGFFVPELLQS